MSARALGEIARSCGAHVVRNVGDVDELVEMLTPLTRPHRIVPRGSTFRLNASMYAIGTANLAFTRLSYGADVRVVPSEIDPDTFLLALGLSGRARVHYGGEALSLSGTDASMIAPYREFRSEIARDYDQVIVAVKTSRIEAVAAGLVGDGGPARLELPLVHIRLQPGASALLEAAATLASDEADAPADFTRRLDDLVIESILLSIPDFRRRMVDSHGRRGRNVGRAMQFMTDHLAEPLTVIEVAAHVGLTPRGLQSAFRREVDQAPMAWLRDRRLDHARRLLFASEQPRPQIRDVARKSGFHHLGEFAAAFKTRFGESPSVMMRRARGGR